MSKHPQIQLRKNSQPSKNQFSRWPSIHTFVYARSAILQMQTPPQKCMYLTYIFWGVYFGKTIYRRGIQVIKLYLPSLHAISYYI